MPTKRLIASVLSRVGERFPSVVRLLARHAPLPPQIRLLQLLTAHWIGQAIAVAAELRIPELLAAGSRSPRELAADLGFPVVDPLHRLLRALASAGLFSEEAEGRFALTDFGQLLVGEQGGSLRALAEICGREWFRGWAELRHSVATGQSGFEQAFGQHFFAYLQEHPGTQQTFDEAMRGVSSLSDLPVAFAYDFARFRRLTDVGGGTGTQLGVILGLHPELTGVLFDLPLVVAHSRTTLAVPDDVQRRLSFVGGDFMKSVPSGSDGYLLKTILHNWNDDDAVQILRTCRASMEPGAHLLLIEHVLLPGAQPQFGKQLDLLMLVMLGGRERTRNEYAVLLEKASFELRAEYPTVAELTILDAIAR